MIKRLNIMNFILLICLFAVFQISSCLKIRSLPKLDRSSISRWAANNENFDNLTPNENSKINKRVVVEITTRNEITAAVATKSKRARRTGVYKEQKETAVEKIMDSPFSTFLGILFNPTTLVLAIYLSSIGWSKVLWLQVTIRLYKCLQ